jgi:hypothetical protein
MYSNRNTRQILIKLEHYGHIFEKYLDIKCYEDPPVGAELFQV